MGKVIVTDGKQGAKCNLETAKCLHHGNDVHKGCFGDTLDEWIINEQVLKNAQPSGAITQLQAGQHAFLATCFKAADKRDKDRITV